MELEFSQLQGMGGVDYIVSPTITGVVVWSFRSSSAAVAQCIKDRTKECTPPLAAMSRSKLISDNTSV